MVKLAILGQNAMNIECLVNDSTWDTGIIQHLQKFRKSQKDDWPEQNRFDTYIVGNLPGKYEDNLAYLQNLVNNGKKVLGIDNGSYSLIEALGGETYDKETPIQGWTLITQKDHGNILTNMPKTFQGYIQQEKDITSLPPNVREIAQSLQGSIQAWEDGNRLYGVNFNPEIDQYAEHLNLGIKYLNNSKKTNAQIEPCEMNYNPMENIIYNFVNS